MKAGSEMVKLLLMLVTRLIELVRLESFTYTQSSQFNNIVALNGYFCHLQHSPYYFPVYSRCLVVTPVMHEF